MLLLSIVTKIFIVHTAFHKEFNKTYRFYLGHTEYKVGAIIQTGMFCTDKTVSSQAGHTSYELELILIIH